MTRALRAHLLRVLLLVLPAIGVLAAPAAASVNSWPDGTRNIVQQGVDNLGISPFDLPADEPERVLAHGYGYLPAGGTDGSGAQLRVRYAKTAGTFKPTIVTLLDFTRDGKPEVAVRIDAAFSNASGGSDTAAVKVYDVTERATATCLSALSATDVVSSSSITYQQPSDDTTLVPVSLDVLAGKTLKDGTPISAGLLAASPPRLVTLVLPRLDNATTATKRLTYPGDAAGTANACSGMPYDIYAATDHHPIGGTRANLVRTDPTPATDADVVDADLRRVAAAQWYRRQTRSDEVVGQSRARDVYPAELEIDFAPAGAPRADVKSLTWVWPTTWSRSTPRSTPGYLIRTAPAYKPVPAGSTAPAEVDPTRVQVTMLRLTASARGASDEPLCLSAAPTTGATTLATFVLPLASRGADGRRLSMAVDALLASEPLSAGTPVDRWRFQTVSEATGDGAPIDIIPSAARFSADGATVAQGCAGGVSLFLDRTHVVGVTQPTASLSVDPAEPAKNTEATFTIGATPGTASVRCSLEQTVAFTACAAGTQKRTITSSRTAYVTVDDTATGAWAAAERKVSLGNSAPSVTLAGPTPDPTSGTDGAIALAKDATRTVSLTATGADVDEGPSKLTYAWTVRSAATEAAARTAAATTIAGAGTAQSYTFRDPAWYVISVTATDTNTPAATSAPATYVVQVVRDPAGAVDIAQPATVLAGKEFTLTGVLASSGYSDLRWAWDVDGGETETFGTPVLGASTAKATFADAGEYPVRVKVVDGGGRVGTKTVLVNARAENEQPPVVDLQITPAGPRTGQTVTFDASRTRVLDPNGNSEGEVGARRDRISFRWDFGEGPEAPVAESTITRTFAGSGQISYKLVVIDSRGTGKPTLSNERSGSITVAPGDTDANAPKPSLLRAAPASPEPVFARRPVTLSAAGTTLAPGHEPATYAFDLDGDGTYERDGGSDPVATFTPAATGPLVAKVRVTDAFGSAAVATLALDVAPEPVAAPTAKIAGPAELRLTGVNVTGTYDAAGSKGNNVDPAVTYRWDLDGNGSYEEYTGAASTATASFSTGGEKAVGVEVTDRYGNVATARTTTAVRSAADIAAGCTGSSTYREVAYRTTRARGCVQTIDRTSSGPLYVLSGTVRVNGLLLVAGSGSGSARAFSDCAASGCQRAQNAFSTVASPLQIAIDPSDGSLRSNKPAALRATGSGLDLPLGSGPLNVNLPGSADDTVSLSSQPGAELFGFPLGDLVTVKFPTAGETTITLNVELPVVAGGFTGTATLRVSSTGAVLFDELRVEVGELTIGQKLTLGSLSFVYSRPDDLWQGGASLTLPTPRPLTISAELAIQRNRFKSIRAEVSDINQPISQAIYLQALRAGVAVDPLDLTGGISVSAGPAVKKKSVLSLDGDVRLRFPSAAANYYLFALTGRLKLADFQLATGYAQFSSNGFFEMGGGLDVDLEIAYVKAYLSGWITKNAFNVDGDAEVGLKINGKQYGLAGAHATFSTTGFAACGEIPVLDLGGGAGARWGDPVKSFTGCDLSPYRAARPADAPATPTFSYGMRAPITALTRGRLRVAGPQGHLLRIPAGTEKVLVTATGAGAPPRLTIVDEAGKVQLSTPADGSDALTTRMLVKSDPKAGTTQVLWKAPMPGDLYVLAQAGSASVTTLGSSLPAPGRTISAKVSGTGSRRTLRWSVSPALAKGESLLLAEEGTGAGTELAVTSQSAGTKPFVPQGGKAGRRRITATVVTDGLPGEAKPVGSYVAPAPPSPARPRSLIVRRDASSATVRWARGARGTAPVATWKVQVRVARAGRQQLFSVPANRTWLRVPNVDRGDAVSVRVVGSAANGIDGPADRAVVRAGLRASSGSLASPDTAGPRSVRVRRLGNGHIRVTWTTGGAYVRGWSIRVSAGVKGGKKGKVTLLRAAGADRSVDVAGAPRGALRVSVIGRRYQGDVTRKDVRYRD